SSSFICCTRPPPTALSTLSLHDALPICCQRDRGCLPHSLERGALRHRPAQAVARHPGRGEAVCRCRARRLGDSGHRRGWATHRRSEEHTSELQSRENLVCRLLLEKKKIT